MSCASSSSVAIRLLKRDRFLRFLSFLHTGLRYLLYLLLTVIPPCSKVFTVETTKKNRKHKNSQLFVNCSRSRPVVTFGALTCVVEHLISQRAVSLTSSAPVCCGRGATFWRGCWQTNQQPRKTKVYVILHTPYRQR